jgi:hypothetical protein
VSDVKTALEAKDHHSQASSVPFLCSKSKFDRHMQSNHGTHGSSALTHAQGVLNTIVSVVYDGLCQWLVAAVNAAFAEQAASISGSSVVASPGASVASLSSIADGDLVILSTPPPSLPASSSPSSSTAPPSHASLAVFNTNIMNERIRSIFIESYARSVGMDGSVMAVSSALTVIDAAPVSAASTSSAAAAASLFSPMSLLALIEQETLAITTTPPQARIASLASNAEAAAAAASSTSLITANNNSAIIIKHYLGDVVYSIADFIDLNRMTLSAATQSLVASSSNAIVKSSLDAVLSQVCAPTP